jgi:hypothetical protein
MFTTFAQYAVRTAALILRSAPTCRLYQRQMVKNRGEAL